MPHFKSCTPNGCSVGPFTSKKGLFGYSIKRSTSALLNSGHWKGVDLAPHTCLCTGQNWVVRNGSGRWTWSGKSEFRKEEKKENVKIRVSWAFSHVTYAGCTLVKVSTYPFLVFGRAEQDFHVEFGASRTFECWGISTNTAPLLLGLGHFL